MISVDQARQKLIESAACKQAVEIVSLAQATGRVIAQDIYSDIEVPAFDNSAMDGYALKASDLQAGQTEFVISQRIPAGRQPVKLESATAARIFTGGVMPAGADAVVIQENCEQLNDGEIVRIRKPVKSGQNVRPKGQDIQQGEQIITTGTRMAAPHVGLIASVGRAQVKVYKPLRVAVFSTGDELIEPGQRLEPGQIYNSNRVMLLALCQQSGFQGVDCGVVEDSLDATVNALKMAAENADVIVSSGGVSVGEEDYVKPALEQVGKLEMWKVRMKPGKPVAFGCVGETPFIGLPGNPVSAYICFQVIAMPFLSALQGVSEQGREHGSGFRVKAGFEKTTTQREEYIRVKLTTDNDGQQIAESYRTSSSGVLSSLSWADGLVKQRVGTDIKPGDWVEYIANHQLV